MPKRPVILADVSRRRFIATTTALAVTGCTPRASFVAAPATGIDATRRIFVVTDRFVDAGLNESDGRATKLSYGMADVVIPSSHQPGEVEYTPGGPEKGPSFSVEQARRFDTADPFLEVLRQAGGQDTEITLFVHGYNNRLPEVIYRQAQIAYDYDVDGPQVVFAWSSAGDPRGYIYDRDSIGFARDSLEQVLMGMANSEPRRIVLVGHSLGCQLVVETLRQMSIGGKASYFDRLAAVILMSPDISIALFERQLARINPRPDPFIILVSQNDRALRFSARLTGQQTRLGSTEDISRLQNLGVGVVNLSRFEENGSNNHFLAATSPAAISLLRGLQAAGPDASWEQRQDIADIVFRPHVE